MSTLPSGNPRRNNWFSSCSRQMRTPMHQHVVCMPNSTCSQLIRCFYTGFYTLECACIYQKDPAMLLNIISYSRCQKVWMPCPTKAVQSVCARSPYVRGSSDVVRNYWLFARVQHCTICPGSLCTGFAARNMLCGSLAGGHLVVAYQAWLVGTQYRPSSGPRSAHSWQHSA